MKCWFWNKAVCLLTYHGVSYQLLMRTKGRQNSVVNDSLRTYQTEPLYLLEMNGQLRNLLIHMRHYSLHYIYRSKLSLHQTLVYSIIIITIIISGQNIHPIAK